MKRKMLAWGIFLAFFLLMSLGTTRYWKVVDAAFMSFSLVMVAVFSVLTVRERWRHHFVVPGKASPSKGDAGNAFLQSFRRWSR